MTEGHVGFCGSLCIFLQLFFGRIFGVFEMGLCTMFEVGVRAKGLGQRVRVEEYGLRARVKG